MVLLEGVYGMPPGRTTRDVDFAVAVDGWPQFETMRNALLHTGHFHPVERSPHKLLFGNGDGPISEIDVVPFGQIAGPDQNIARRLVQSDGWNPAGGAGGGR
ncbi:hypothetical protein FNU76_01245 [Chitinimonas arctica]|uniref:Nucleotidyltransferase family protein n=1 Tax=Chitinimonas arctica TaxID=2594795 RepID=A0A516SAB3_9NEIS|nr:hypothetical protein [Chitinimonas arctica]QDQ25086.1 hypothetical protein FNU76_01245 [Chitinimonas arctica]